MGSSELSSSLTFPIKLKKIVDAEETDSLIHWSEDGNSFHITDENQFARDIIPNYFKHSNISSFIRQLNMYGFHKVNRIENGLSIIGTGNDDSQWVHPNFVRDKPELLTGVLRKSATNSEIIPFDSVKTDISQLAKMVQYLRKRDEETTEQLKLLQNENHELYTELMFLRDQHDKQSKCIDMLIEFFSQYAKTPNNSRLRSKRNILALECPQFRNLNLQKNQNEPPRKFHVTSSGPGNFNSNNNSNVFKGKKVIKISNMNQPSHIDVKTPKNINSFSNNTIYNLPTLGNTNSQKTPVIYTLSLPKNVNSTNNSVKAITASSTGPSIIAPRINNTCKSTLSLKSNQPNKKVTVSTITANNDSIYNAQKVTVSSITANNDSIYNAQYFDSSLKDNIFSTNNNSNYQQFSPPENLNVYTPNSANIVSGISSNVNDMEQCLNDIQEMFNEDVNCDKTSLYNPELSDDIMIDDDWKMLLENIRSDNSLENSDPDRIHGHELIPFSGHQSEEVDDNGQSVDSYSIDDLLQTPNIYPGMSSLSLDNMDNVVYHSDNVYQNTLKKC